MALITPQAIAGASITPALTTPSASDTVLPLEDMFYVVRTTTNADNVTVSDSGTTPAGNPATVTPVALGTSTERWIPIGPAQANPATGLITITHSSTTGVTAGVFYR